MGLGIAIVEDNEKTADSLEEMVVSFFKNSEEVITIKRYTDGLEFLAGFNKEINIVLMDIRMPNMDGMEAAVNLRRVASDIVIIFITSMAQYALQGYKVDALSYLLKPLKYKDFAFVMNKAVKNVKKLNMASKTIQLSSSRGIVVLHSSEIVYIEILKHRLFYHTADDTFDIYGMLGDAEEQLAAYSFGRCNTCYLVNLAYVKWAKRYSLTVNCGGKDIELPISRNKYMSFMEKFKEYLNGVTL